MKSKISFIIYILIFISSHIVYGGRLSSQLPDGLNRLLFDQSLITPEEEDSNSQNSIELLDFYSKLKQLSQASTGKAKSNSLVKECADMLVDKSLKQDLDKARIGKITILRFLIENPMIAQTANINYDYLINIKNEWIKIYIELSITLLKESNISDYVPTIDNFKTQINNRKVNFQDLNQYTRFKLNSELGTSHGISLTQQTNNGIYDVNGMYDLDHQLFALDFSRPLGETIITISHEIIHAADPIVLAHREKFNELTPKVVGILNRVLNITSDVRSIIVDFLSQVFFEVGRPDIIEKLGAVAKKYITAYMNAPLENGQKWDKNDELIITQWMRAAIGMTVENEYRAHGLASLVYSKLKLQYQIMLPSKAREIYLNEFISGDYKIANNLAHTMNPFKLSYDKYLTIVKKYQFNDAQKINFDRWTQFVQSIYISELNSFLAQLNNHFANLIKTSVSINEVKNVTIPKWTNPESLDSQANSLTLITARVSPLWVRKSVDNISKIHLKLVDIRNTLLSLRAGILDFHDTDIEGFKLLNLISPNTSNEAELVPNCDISSYYNEALFANFNRFFNSYNSQNSFTPDSAIRIDNLLGELLKLKLVETQLWMEQKFPELKINILGAKRFIDKLDDPTNFLEPEQFPPERIKQLKGQLSEAINGSTINGEELLKIKTLVEVLNISQTISSENSYIDPKLSELKAIFLQKQDEVLKMINLGGLETNFSIEKFNLDWETSFKTFQKEIESTTELCDQVMIHKGQTPPITLIDHSFKPSYICSKKKTYLFRLPCDAHLNSSPYKRNGVDYIMPIQDSKYIELLPFNVKGNIE